MGSRRGLAKLLISAGARQPGWQLGAGGDAQLAEEGERELVPGVGGFQQAGRLGQEVQGMVCGDGRGVRPERDAERTGVPVLRASARYATAAAVRHDAMAGLSMPT